MSGYKDHIYSKYSPYLVSFTKEELFANVHRVLVSKMYIDKNILEKIRVDHGFAFDGNVITRFKKICINLIENTHSKEL